MSQNTTPVSRDRLLSEANAYLQQHEDYLQGIAVTDVEQKGPLLVFKGDYFLDERGLPTRKSTVVFNLFKALTQHFSERYHLTE